MTYNAMELMICCAARSLEDGRTVAVGTGAPCAAAMLARTGAAAAVALARDGADLAITGRRMDAEAEATRDRILQLGRRCELIAADAAIPASRTKPSSPKSATASTAPPISAPNM